MRRLTMSSALLAGLIWLSAVVSATGFANYAAQDDVWIDSFTIDDEPVGGDLLASTANKLKLSDMVRKGNNRGGRLWNPWRALAAIFRFGWRTSANDASAPMLISPRSAAEHTLLGITRTRAIVPAWSSMGSFVARCAGGATSGNPDADIDVFIEIWLEGSGLIAQAQARGYTPSAVASATVTTVEYARWIECYASAGLAYAQVRGTVLPDCGDARTGIIREYYTYNVTFRPVCADFSSSGGTTHFTWSELNGGFSDGNPHSPWGIVRQSLKDNLEQTRTNYNRGGIRLSSGYRCPHGNASLPDAAPQSLHMQGRAADMYSTDYPWTETEFNLLRDAANNTNPVESFSWDTYGNHHYHAAWN